MRVVMVMSLAAAGYVFLRGVMPTHWKWWYKVTAGGLLLWIGLCFPMMSWLGGSSPFAPDLPAWLILLYSGLYMVMTFLTVFMLVGGGMLSLLHWLIPTWRGQNKAARLRMRNCMNAALLAGAVLVCCWGMYSALRAPRVHEVTLRLPVAKSLRIAVLSDLHADSVKGAAVMQRFVDVTLAQKPDLILFLGDFVDGSVKQRLAALQPLTKLRAPLGVYGVPGNHEYYSGFEQWIPKLTGLGIHMLINEHVVLSENGVVLAGVTDPAARLFGQEQPSVAKALEDAPRRLPVILLAHQPQLVCQARDNGVALQLSGHTHGGMVLGLHWLVGRFNSGLSFGLYQRDNLQVYVTPGTSLWTMMPIRLGVPSEITVLNILPKN